VRFKSSGGNVLVVSVFPEAVITVRVCFFRGEAAAETKYGLTLLLSLTMPLPPPTPPAEATLLLFNEFVCFEVVEVVEAWTVVVGVQRQWASSTSSAVEAELPLVLLVVLLLPFPPTTVTSPEVAPLTTACSHLTALDFREVTRADDRLGLLAPAAASACIRVIGLEGDKAAEVVAGAKSPKRSSALVTSRKSNAVR
jgi:hypothetical protein